MWLSEVLARRVEETGGNQAAYARSIGVTPQTLNHMLQGNIKVPNPESRRRIARDLGMSHIDLLVKLGELTEDEVGGAAPEIPPAHRRVLDALAAADLEPRYVELVVRFVGGLGDARHSPDAGDGGPTPTATSTGRRGRGTPRAAW